MRYGFMTSMLLLVLVLVVTVAIGLSGYMLIAQSFNTFGMIAVLSGLMIWIVAVDSRKRWPGVGWFDRFVRVITFYRD